MTIRCGMSGDVVKRIQDLLSGLDLYRGPIDSMFGGGLESAVKNFQSQHGLFCTGLVDGPTWMLMFPGEAVPPSPLAGASLTERCLAVTGAFETGKYHPDCFCAVSGDFDGMGISFGVLQWNVGQGTLQPLLKQMFEMHPEVSETIFNEHFTAVKTLGVAALNDQLAFSRSIQDRGNIREPWRGMLITLGRAPECQQIQAIQAAKLFEQALHLCSDFSLCSERGAALMFDVVSQNGSIGANVKALILADYARLPHDELGNEVLRMCSVANHVADASRSRYVEDVRSRKLTIAHGEGIVHGIPYDLADMFNITLRPLGTGASAASASR